MEHSGALGQWSHQVHASVHDMINAWNLILDTCISTRGTLSLDDNPIKETFWANFGPFFSLVGFLLGLEVTRESGMGCGRNTSMKRGIIV